MSQTDVVIIGGGLAGLCCARRLHQEGIRFALLEASDGWGGRVRTDEVDGFLLDRGFQVLLTAYPEARRVLDYEALDLRAFLPGAIVRRQGHFFRLSDPWRESGSWLRNLFSPVGTLRDKLRLARMRSSLLRRPPEKIFEAPETTTREALERRKFSSEIIEEFFRPWFGGIQLDPRLGGSSRMFEFVFQMMSEGDSAVPARGMGRIPEQIAASLPPGCFRLNVRVDSLEGRQITLHTGEIFSAPNIVLAVEGPEAHRLLKRQRTVPGRPATCLYFAAEQPPIADPVLVLGGSGRGLINNLAVMSNVSPEYAPPGQHLVSISVLGAPSREQKSTILSVTAQLRRWFGNEAGDWRFLRMYQIGHAQPVVTPLEWIREPRIEPGLYLAGDHCATPSIQGAMESGRLAAEALLRDLGAGKQHAG